MLLDLSPKDHIVVTCGLPYANGSAHIGHLRTYIPGDAYVRYLKRFGYKALFVCGSDTHGAPIELQARKAGISPRELVSKYHAHFKDIFQRLRVDVDFYGSTDEPYHYRRAQSIIRTLEDRGYIETREARLPYCPNCRMFLADRFLVGQCPYCGAEARGDECDQGCHRYLDADQLIDPRCVICGSHAEIRPTRHHYFKLPLFAEFLTHFNEHLQGTPVARNYALGWLRQGLKDWCISRNLEWGIPYPGDEKLKLYVWAENYAGYISFTEEWARQTGADWEDYWRRNGKIIHFIGADIVYHHALFWPAMLKGADYAKPWAIVASGMVKVEGHVFSKSRGFATYVEEDYIKNGFNLDAVRYYILSYTAHTKDLDFAWSDFQRKVNNELVGILGNFAYRALLFNFKNFKQVPTGNLIGETKRRIQQAIITVRKSIDDFKFKEAADAAMQLATYGNSTFQACQPWKRIKEDPKECQASLYDSLQLLKAIAILIEPVLPTTVEKLWRQLGQTGDVHKTRVGDCLIPLEPGTPLTKPQLLFEKIPDEIIERMTTEFKERIERALDKSNA
jgi:methionyl-tRNA synthetase